MPDTRNSSSSPNTPSSPGAFHPFLPAMSPTVLGYLFVVFVAWVVSVYMVAGVVANVVAAEHEETCTYEARTIVTAAFAAAFSAAFTSPSSVLDNDGDGFLDISTPAPTFNDPTAGLWLDASTPSSSLHFLNTPMPIVSSDVWVVTPGGQRVATVAQDGLVEIEPGWTCEGALWTAAGFMERLP